MCNIICGGITTGLGLVLVVASCIVSFVVVPGIVDDIIKSEVQLINNTEQMERFEEVPFALTFTVRIFNISNPEEVLTGGIPIVKDIGPYIYRMTQRRVIEAMDEDTITYRRVDTLVFDEQASYPYSVEDRLTLVNAGYHVSTTLKGSSHSTCQQASMLRWLNFHARREAFALKA
ncbi:unnamed protein product [Euphydryas editha]|uniref:Sensory neuron membrane protein 2 n=1 Tax=Euphydryas editha TaxID=104508 RepID=A0AAU9UVH6_EUPED|nr:unnamed protein product [Euphydryas editha]